MEHCVASTLLGELKAMFMYTADKGDPIPAEIMPTAHQMEGKLADESSPGLAALTADELHHQAAWHNQMAGQVAPASPRSIYLMQKPESGFLSF